MGYDFTDSIDECCEAIVGHNNWGFADSDLHKTVESIMSKRNGDSPKSNRIEYVVLFYKDEIQDEPYDEV